MIRVQIKTSRATFNAIVENGVVFVDLAGIAELKNVEVESVVARIVELSNVDQSGNVQAQTISTLRSQASAELDIVDESNLSKKGQVKNLRKQISECEDPGEIVSLQAQLRRVSVSLDEGLKEAKSLKQRVEDLTSSLSELKVFDGTVNVENVLPIIL